MLGPADLVGCVKGFMQLAGTRAGDSRVGRVGGPDGVELRRRRSEQRMGQAVPVPAAGLGLPAAAVGAGRVPRPVRPASPALALGQTAPLGPGESAVAVPA